MQVETFLRNKIKRQILWNGQEFTFQRFAQNSYYEITDEVGQTFEIKGVFHDGGGYGGMLNLELYEREGSRDFSKMKPMILCLYDDVSKEIAMDDRVEIGDNKYFVVEKNDIKNLHIAYEISLEKIQDEVQNNGGL